MMVFMVGFAQKSRVNANSFHFCKLYLPDGEASPEAAPEHILLPSRSAARGPKCERGEGSFFSGSGVWRARVLAGPPGGVEGGEQDESEQGLGKKIAMAGVESEAARGGKRDGGEQHAFLETGQLVGDAS